MARPEESARNKQTLLGGDKRLTIPCPDSTEPGTSSAGPHCQTQAAVHGTGWDGFGAGITLCLEHSAYVSSLSFWLSFWMFYVQGSDELHMEL